jgi:hypothetical protein
LVLLFPSPYNGIAVSSCLGVGALMYPGGGII